MESTEAVLAAVSHASPRTLKDGGLSRAAAQAERRRLCLAWHAKGPLG